MRTAHSWHLKRVLWKKVLRDYELHMHGEYSTAPETILNSGVFQFSNHDFAKFEVFLHVAVKGI